MENRLHSVSNQLTQMKKITLQFESLQSLIDFTLLIELTNCKIDEANYRLTCELNESQIELAKAGFNATIILPGSF